ncbi:MAG: hypothetical protein QOG27_1727, partial [Verrucomicrobiota bacterium]
AQISRFPHVNDAVEAIAHQVHTRLVRHLVHLLCQIWSFLFCHRMRTVPGFEGSFKERRFETADGN